MTGTVVVTGGSAGIGAGIVATFLESGATVIVLDRQPPAASHPRLLHVTVDLTDITATRQAGAEVAAQHPVDRLVHNAGIIRPNLVESVQPEDIEQLTRLHITAPTLLLQAFLPGMQARHFGRVILISSRAALGVVTRTAYAATKAGLIGLTRTWALELAKYGITVNAVAPGPVGGTDMFEALVPPGSDTETAITRSIPIGRLGRAADVANAVRFFAANESDFVTGQVLYVCGGASVGVSPV